VTEKSEALSLFGFAFLLSAHRVGARYEFFIQVSSQQLL